MTLSIILPVYNVAPYIGRCLTSILGQLADVDAEVILVDDCSTDDSIAQATKVIGQDPHFRIVRHGQNRGLSAARNTGMASATGDYVLFIDSDDVLADGCLATLVSLADAHPDADVVVGQFDEFEADGEFRPAKWRQHGGVYDGDVIAPYLNGDIPVTAWNKLYRTKFLSANALMFEEGLVHEDALWSFQVACCARKVVVADAVTYHYRQRGGSLDKQNNRPLHWWHYGRVYALQTDFVFAHGLQRNRLIFKTVEKNRFQLLADACRGDRATFDALYTMLRDHVGWNLWQRTSVVFPGLKPWLRNLHWSLPRNVGRWIFAKIYG